MSPENIYSAPAAADYSASGYVFGTIDTSGNVARVGTASSVPAVGVIKNSPVAAEQARLEWGGVQKILAGTGGLTLGGKVYSDANGKGVTAVATAGAFFMGVCTRAAAAGAVGEFLWSPGANAG